MENSQNSNKDCKEENISALKTKFIKTNFSRFIESDEYLKKHLLNMIIIEQGENKKNFQICHIYFKNKDKKNFIGNILFDEKNSNFTFLKDSKIENETSEIKNESVFGYGFIKDNIQKYFEDAKTEIINSQNDIFFEQSISSYEKVINNKNIINRYTNMTSNMFTKFRTKILQNLSKTEERNKLIRYIDKYCLIKAINDEIIEINKQKDKDNTSKENNIKEIYNRFYKSEANKNEKYLNEYTFMFKANVKRLDKMKEALKNAENDLILENINFINKEYYRMEVSSSCCKSDDIYSFQERFLEELTATNKTNNKKSINRNLITLNI